MIKCSVYITACKLYRRCSVWQQIQRETRPSKMQYTFQSPATKIMTADFRIKVLDWLTHAMSVSGHPTTQQGHVRACRIYFEVEQPVYLIAHKDALAFFFFI